MTNLDQENSYQLPPPPPPLGGGGEAVSNTHSSSQKPRASIYRWRMRGTCPCCLEKWRIDFDSATDPADENFSPKRMSSGILCGSCLSRQRLYLFDSGFVAPLWGLEDVARIAANLERDEDAFRPASTRSNGEVPPDAPPCEDTIKSEAARIVGKSSHITPSSISRLVGKAWDTYIAEARFREPAKGAAR